MKLFFALAVVISSLALLVQGAPPIRSEELGKTMEQLKELINRELVQAAEANTRQWPYAQQRPPAGQWPHAQQRPQKFRSIQQSERVIAEVSGVDIRNCGAAGNVINTALAILDLFKGQFGVLVDCQLSPGCVKVQVDAPTNNPVADVDVCVLGNGQACVEVRANRFCTGGFPIPISIPLSNGQQISIQIIVDIFRKCAAVTVNAPQCPGNQIGK